jgi:PAS domain S-box-containing protein
MGKALRLLIIEDVEDHALLLVRELEKGGMRITFQRVETVDELKGALDAGPWDAIISDFNLPGFDGVDALRIVQEKGEDAPFLLVSGAIGEEKAAEVMRAGAHDYIRKGNYARLIPTLERELRDAKVRRERRQTADELSRYREHLEELVHERTEELVKVNAALKAEKLDRERALLQLEAVLDNIQEGVVISDLDGRLVAMNKEALELHQYASAAPVGQHVTELRETFEVMGLDGEPLAFEAWPLPRVLRGERFSGAELQIRRKDTGAVWIGSYSGTPVCNKDGETCLAVITVRDITEKKRKDEALRKSEAKFVKIFNYTPSLVTISTLPEGKIVDVNETVLRTLGYQRDEVIGRTTADFGIWVDEAQRLAVLRLIEEEGAARNVEIRLKRKDGSILVGLFNAVLLRLEDEQFMLSFVKDITERKLAEEEIARLNAVLAARVSELEERNQELEAFNRMVSHDLRQPLNNISLAVQAIDMFCAVEADCRDAIDMAGNGVNRMNTLIDTLLAFSRSTHGDLHRELFDLTALAKSVVADLRASEPERQVEFNIAEGITADGDPKFLRAVLENLIGNAWKYTGKTENAAISFGVTEVEGERTYFVQDNGPGFDMADAAKLFVPFQRLSDSDEFKGSGIGLATVDRIVKRHGGRVWASSAPGKGATFLFTLDAGEHQKV